MGAVVRASRTVAFPKPVKPETAKKLAELGIRVHESVKERDRAIFEALREGASHQAVADAVGLSQGRVTQIAMGLGWPDARERKRREKEKAMREALRHDLDEYRRLRLEDD